MLLPELSASDTPRPWAMGIPYALRAPDLCMQGSFLLPEIFSSCLWRLYQGNSFSFFWCWLWSFSYFLRRLLRQLFPRKCSLVPQTRLDTHFIVLQDCLLIGILVLTVVALFLSFWPVYCPHVPRRQKTAVSVSLRHRQVLTSGRISLSEVATLCHCLFLSNNLDTILFPVRQGFSTLVLLMFGGI